MEDFIKLEKIYFLDDERKKLYIKIKYNNIDRVMLYSNSYYNLLKENKEYKLIEDKREEEKIELFVKTYINNLNKMLYNKEKYIGNIYSDSKEKANYIVCKKDNYLAILVLKNGFVEEIINDICIIFRLVNNNLLNLTTIYNLSFK